jgi:LEA14-like dessication related protein
METKTIVILGASAFGVAALGIYGKKQYNMVINDIYYDYDKTSVVIKKLSLTSVVLTMDFIIDNRGELSKDVKDLKLKVSTGGKEITYISRDKEFKILPNTKVPINITIALDPTNLIKNTLKDIKLTEWKQIPLTFDGSVKVKVLGLWMPIPFKFTYPIGEFL